MEFSSQCRCPQYQLDPFDRIKRTAAEFYATAEFSNHTVCHKLKYHPHHLDTWYFTTVRFCKNFLSRATQLWNDQLTAVFPGRYDLVAFKKRVYLLKGWQRTCSSSDTTRGSATPVYTRGDNLPSGNPYACLPCIFQ